MLFELLFPTNISFYFVASVFLTLSVFSKWFTYRKHEQQAPGSVPLPGPLGLPWAGPVWDVDPEHMWKTFGNWAKKFGNIYQVTLFGQDFVIISDPGVAKDILSKQGAVCSDRPQIPNIPSSKTGGYLPFLGHNDVLRRQRKFGVYINSTSFKAQYHGHIIPEVKGLLHNLLGKTDEYDVFVKHAFARISCKLAWGVPEPASEIIHNMHHLMKNLSPAGRTINVLKFLRHVPTFLSFEKQHEVHRRQHELLLWSGLLDYARRQHVAGKLPPCYAQYYFEDKQTGKSELSDEEAIYAVGMMATVAIITLACPVGWFVVAMALYPEWQRAAQEELERVCEGGRMVELGDMPQMPLLRALILEVLRWQSTVPTGIPHYVEEDIMWNGHTIKKGTNVMACDWAMSRNSMLYPNPNTFNPERWLNPAFPTFREPLTEFPKVHGHHAFGFGRRTCVGQDHVASVLFITFGSLLWGYNIKPQIHSCGKPVKINVETATPNVIPLPQAQKLTFEPRSADRLAMMKGWGRAEEKA